ncbi:hypothetical protein niasHS_003138 [Heterodera schachtii]|uniref:Uncharacterized protein n=1 Tax=Heterodera schachtii TaxID=97005 RepID=A0ABD2KAE8_HETSC
MASRARKMPFEGDSLDFTSLREENGLAKDDFRKGVLLYLCYGGNETAMLVNNVAITVPILNYIFIGPLLEQLFEFILESPNPFTMQKRICVGGHHPIDLPRSLSQPARVMASKGIQPQSFVRPNPATPIINRLSGQVQQLQQMVAQLESEKRMLERMMVMKVEPMDMEDSTAQLPGIKGGGEHWPVDFEVAFGMERMSLNC